MKVKGIGHGRHFEKHGFRTFWLYDLCKLIKSILSLPMMPCDIMAWRHMPLILTYLAKNTDKNDMTREGCQFSGIFILLKNWISAFRS